jgi:hypothetical protein
MRSTGLGGGGFGVKFKSNIWIVESDWKCVECRGLGVAVTPGGEDKGIVLEVVEVIDGLVTLLFNLLVSELELATAAYSRSCKLSS